MTKRNLEEQIVLMLRSNNRRLGRTQSNGSATGVMIRTTFALSSETSTSSSHKDIPFAISRKLDSANSSPTSSKYSSTKSENSISTGKPNDQSCQSFGIAVFLIRDKIIVIFFVIFPPISYF